MPTRRSLILLAALGLAPGALAHPQAAAPALGEVEREILAARAALKEAIEARDAARLRELYADGFTHIHGSGKLDGKDARIVSVIAGDPVIETAPVSELAFRPHGPDVVVLTGRSPILNRAEGRTYDFRFTQVFVRTGGLWRLAASQATRLPATA